MKAVSRVKIVKNEKKITFQDVRLLNADLFNVGDQASQMN